MSAQFVLTFDKFWMSLADGTIMDGESEEMDATLEEMAQPFLEADPQAIVCLELTEEGQPLVYTLGRNSEDVVGDVATVFVEDEWFVDHDPGSPDEGEEVTA